MADAFDALPDWFSGYLSRLRPAELKQLTRTLARDLQSSQRERVKAQQNPDGSHYQPRKIQHRNHQRAGRIRRAMFSKLMQAKWLKAKNNGDSITLEFTGRVQRMAQAHQFGLKDKVREGIEATYPIRELLGITPAEREKIKQAVLDYLAAKN
jgi:phage virion morphogenesis protein